MTNTDVVKSWNEAFFSGDIEKALGYLADDFQFTGPVPEPLGPQAFMGMMNSMLSAFPDLDNHFEITGESGNTVTGSVVMAGTHSQNFDLSGMGGPVIPPTGKSFRNPKESFIITVKDGKIARFDVDVPENGGLGNILNQLGVQMP